MKEEEKEKEKCSPAAAAGVGSVDEDDHAGPYRDIYNAEVDLCGVSKRTLRQQYLDYGGFYSRSVVSHVAVTPSGALCVGRAPNKELFKEEEGEEHEEALGDFYIVLSRPAQLAMQQTKERRWLSIYILLQLSITLYLSAALLIFTRIPFTKASYNGEEENGGRSFPHLFSSSSFWDSFGSLFSHLSSMIPLLSLCLSLLTYLFGFLFLWLGNTFGMEAFNICIMVETLLGLLTVPSLVQLPHFFLSYAMWHRLTSHIATILPQWSTPRTLND
ncbi:hypothetical protein QOT17_000139 [Balamuthia mandrillaris]